MHDHSHMQPGHAAHACCVPAPEGGNTSLKQLQLRLGVSAAFTLPLLVLGHMGHLPAVQAALAAPVVLWGGLPFFLQGFKALRQRRADMFTLLALSMGVSFLYSLLAWLLPQEPMPLYFESGAAIVTLALLGQWLEAKAGARMGDAVRALLDLAPPTAELLLEDGATRSVPASELQPGYWVRVLPGARVPADGVVTEGESELNEAMLTGEAQPVFKTAGDRVTGGSINGAGHLLVQVERVGADSTLARMAALVKAARESRPRIQRAADAVSAWFVPGVVGLALATGAFWFLWNGDAAQAVQLAVAVLVVACPCALGLAAPLSISIGTGAAARAGVLFRHAEALEALDKVDTLVIDKTGTLTLGQPKLLSVMPTDGHSETNLLRLAASLEQQSEHPLAKAVVLAAQKKQIGLLKAHAFKYVVGKGVSGIVDGRSVAIGNGSFIESMGIPLTLRTKAEPYKSQGQTVLFVAMDHHCIGLLTLADAIKPEAHDALSQLRAQGISIAMMTGDNKTTAMAVARKLEIEQVEAEAPPARKTELVAALQEKGRNVAMAGDGVNDAAALAQAQVGIAMGGGTDVAMESAGVTLLRGDLLGIVRARHISKLVMRNVRENLAFAFGYNMLALPLAAGALAPWGITLTPMMAGGLMTLSSLTLLGNSFRLRQSL